MLFCMPRSLRVHLPGGFYHVTLRGNHRREIFSSDADYLLLNKIVARAAANFGARVHAYCWMRNHIHLLLQAGSESIAHPMRNIAAEFARAMQVNSSTTGHFFERRYHATLVDTDSYLLGVVRYIHRNPVKAGLVRDPADFPWSSHHVYAGHRIESWIATEFALGVLATDRAQAMAAYRLFVGSDFEEPWIAEMASNGGEAAVLGGEEFQLRVSRPALQRRRQTLEQLLAEACDRFAVDAELLDSPTHNPYLAKVRAWIGFQAGKRGVATLSAVARALNRDEATIRYAIRKYPGELE
jgi:REP element-mobilizing transposase RayT